MNKKRDRMQIHYDMLVVMAEHNGAIKPTRLLYRSNLSHVLFEQHIKELMEKKFISLKTTSKEKTYQILPRGFTYIQKYRHMMEFIESFGMDD